MNTPLRSPVAWILAATTAFWLSGCSDPAPPPSPEPSPSVTNPVEDTASPAGNTPSPTAAVEGPTGTPTNTPTAMPSTPTPDPAGSETPSTPVDTPPTDTPGPVTQTPSGPTPGDSPTEAPTPTGPTPGLTATPGFTPTPSLPPASETPVSDFDQDDDGYPTQAEAGVPLDCADFDASIHPGAEELPYDGVDQDCDGQDLVDQDQDGWAGGPTGPDCDDQDPLSAPDGLEVPYDDIDQDCDGQDLTDQDEDGWEGGADGSDCNDLDDTVSPSAQDIPYDGVDQDCSGTDLIDVDADGHAASSMGGDDCNDTQATVHPGATELPYDGVDQDCTGGDLDDVDGDGFRSVRVGGPDCDDENPAINPEALEVCDGIDNNCDGMNDFGAVDANTYYPDMDGDSYGNPSAPIQGCAPEYGQVSNGLDCNDGEASAYPGATETCDGLDNNCDTQVDEGLLLPFYTDADEDGFGDPSALVEACEAPEGTVEDATDCDDGAETIYPGAAEVCNDLDDDCDDSVDEAVRLTFYRDADSDGFGSLSSSASACTAPAGYSPIGGDCNDSNPAINPSAQEVCDPANTDEDCDTRADDADASVLESSKSTFYVDGDGDGYGAAAQPACDLATGLASSAGDCSDTDAAIKPGATELAGDSIDQNCDGQEVCFRDADDDGYRPDSTSTTASSDTDCADTAEAKTTDPTGDCADTNPAIHPNQTELPDGIDQNCSGQADEGAAHLSCKSLKQYLPGTPSGVYTIDPDGASGSLAPFEVYCDMVTDGGGWTVIPPSKIGTYATVMSTFRTDTVKVIFYILRSDGAQFHTVAQQLAAFAQYPVTVTESSDRLTVTFIPRNVANVSGMTQGFRSNGVDLTFSNCDGNPNSYLEFWRAGSSYSWTQDYNMSMRWRDTKQATTASLPSAYYGFTAIHFGGCGTHSTSPAWSAYDGAISAALGVR